MALPTNQNVQRIVLPRTLKTESPAHTKCQAQAPLPPRPLVLSAGVDPQGDASGVRP